MIARSKARLAIPAAFALALVLPTAAHAATGTQTMLRVYNPYTGEHLYTSSTSERNSLTKLGWRDEGVGWVAPTKSKTPVYRLYNKYSGDHHYTTSKSEYDKLGKAGWNKEGTGWYSDDNKGVPLYRQFNPYAKIGTHNYTVSKHENDTLVKSGWKAEGIAWYGVNTAGPNARYDSILSEYQSAQKNDWAKRGTNLEDLYALERIGSGDVSRYDIELYRSNLNKQTVSYAYYDLGNDGKDDLIIGLIDKDGSSTILAIFTTDGKSITSVTKGSVATSTIWRVVKGGRVVRKTQNPYQITGSYITNYKYLYSIKNGKPSVDDSYWSYRDPFMEHYHGPVGNKAKSVRVDESYVTAAFEDIPDASGINWKPLSGFVPLGYAK